MFNQDNPNYPDILNYITGGESISVGVVQFAMSVTPERTRSGHPFRVIILMQNLSDVNVSVITTITLPKGDAIQPEFMLKTDRLTTTLRPGEVGYAVVPVTSLPDRSINEAFTLRADFEVKPREKPRRVRSTGEKPIKLDYYFNLSEQALEDITRLRQLKFKVKRAINPLKTAMLGAGTGLEASFTLLPARTGKLYDLQPRWFSLWTLAENTDVRPLMERYHEMLKSEILPALSIRGLFARLPKITQEKFNAAGYDIQPGEVHYIVKLMLLVIQLSHQANTDDLTGVEAEYAVAALLKRGWPEDGTPVPLPRWCRAFLHSIDYDESVVQNPLDTLTGPLYADLIRDAMHLGFHIIQQHSDAPLGTDEEIRIYINHLTQAMWHSDYPLAFVDVFLPMVLAGVLIDERVRIPNEVPLTHLNDVLSVVQAARPQADEDSALVFELADDIVQEALRKYGYRY